MSEAVVPLDLGVTWAPNGADCVLVSDDSGRTVLALDCDDIRDSDRRAVALIWNGTRFASLGGPNDEAISGHRLYHRGLRMVQWAGEVHDSELMAELEQRNRVHHSHNAASFAALRHFVVLTKESTIEVVAETLRVDRVEGDTLTAATTTIRVQ